MEAHLRAALRAGIAEAEFWILTPYRMAMRLQEAGRRRLEDHLYAAWFGNALSVDRVTRLHPPSHYVRQFLDGDDDVADEAAANAMFERMAADWGLEVEDAEQEG